MSRSSQASPRLLAALAVAGVVSIPAVGWAAEAIEEVVVTAQRTEQSVQEVPIAVSAFSGEMMEDKQIINPSDLQLAAPNVSFTATNFGGSSFSIRGIGRLVIAGSGENGVSIHQNQIAVPTNLPAAEFYDLERVEVLRGPQGTLFGRNATGGAVNMVTKMPDFESWNGNWDVETGDYSHRRIKGALNIPVTDNFAIRMAGMALERDGYIENTAYKQRGDCVIPGTTLVDAYGPSANNANLPNSANIQSGNINPNVTQPCSIANIDDDIDGRDITTYRITAAWQILDNMDAWLQYSSFREDDDKVRITNQVCEQSALPTLGCTADGKGWDVPHNGSTTGGLFGGLNEAVLLGTASPYNGFPQRGTGYRKQHTDYEPEYFYEEDMWTMGVNYDFENYRVGLLAGYVEQNYNSRQDYLMDVGNVLFANAQNPAGLWPTSDTANNQAGADWTDAQCNFNDGTSGIFGGCVMDVDQTRVFAFDQASSESEYLTVELKLESDLEGPLNFVVGTNYSEYEGYGDYYVVANTLDLVGLYGVPKLGFPPLYPTLFNSTSNPNGDGSMGDSIAYFGEVYYDLTESLKLTVGLRYNDDHKEVSDSGVLYNAVNVNALVGGLLGPDPFWSRTTGFLFGAPAGDLERYYVPEAQLAAASATGVLSPERLAVSRAVPLAPGFNEQRVLTGSPSEEDFQETTGRIGLDWQINDQTMVYGFFTRGYKPGGFNPPQNADLATESVKYIFDSEQVDAYEIGAKNVFRDGTLMVNAAAFMYDYGGLQTTRIRNNNSINDNIDAQIMGLELEVFWQPEWAPGLSIDASYAYLKAEVDGSTSLDPLNRTAGNPDFITLKNIDPGSATAVNYVARVNGTGRITDAIINAGYAGCGALSSLNPNAGCPAVTSGTTYTGISGLTQELPAYFSRSFLASQGVEVSDGFNVDLDGNSLPNAPENTFHLGAAYTWQIDQIAGALTARWDYSWRDDQYAREFNTKGDFIEAWFQHNAALIYESNDGHWEGRLWIRNILNDDNITGKYLTSDTSGFFRNYFLTEPRLFGASLKYSFGEQ
jgi:outer membrane receptor protein involved in Fe transport